MSERVYELWIRVSSHYSWFDYCHYSVMVHASEVIDRWVWLSSHYSGFDHRHHPRWVDIGKGARLLGLAVKSLL